MKTIKIVLVFLFYFVHSFGQKSPQNLTIQIDTIRYNTQDSILELKVVFCNPSNSLEYFELEDFTFTRTEGNYYLSVIANDSLQLYSMNLFGGYPGKPKFINLYPQDSYILQWKIRLNALNTLDGFVNNNKPLLYTKYKLQLFYYNRQTKIKGSKVKSFQSNVLEIML